MWYNMVFYTTRYLNRYPNGITYSIIGTTVYIINESSLIFVIIVLITGVKQSQLIVLILGLKVEFDNQNINHRLLYCMFVASFI